MLLLMFGVAGLVVGLAAGGRFVRLLEVRFRWPLVVLAAYIVKEAGVFFAPLSASPIAPWLYVVALAALVAWTLWHRRQLRGIEVVAAGMAMNLVAVLANFGHMPVSRALADRGPKELLIRGVLGQYVLAGHGTRLEWLGDWIELPGTLGRLLPQAYSPGDLVAALGMGITLFLVVRPLGDMTPTR